MSKQNDKIPLKSILRKSRHSESKSEKQVEFSVEGGAQEEKEVLRNEYATLKESVDQERLDALIRNRQVIEIRLTEECISHITEQRNKLSEQKHKLSREEFAKRLEAVEELNKILQDNPDILLSHPTNPTLELIKQANSIAEQDYSEEVKVYNRMQEIKDKLKDSYGSWSKESNPLEEPAIRRLPRKNPSSTSRGI